MFGVVVGGGRSEPGRAQDATMPAQDRPWWPWAGIGADYTRAPLLGALWALQRPEEISKEISGVGLGPGVTYAVASMISERRGRDRRMSGWSSATIVRYRSAWSSYSWRSISIARTIRADTIPIASIGA